MRSFAIFLKAGFQSTHPVRGGTQGQREKVIHIYISIHPPREGWDIRWQMLELNLLRFQSTHPVRGGTEALEETARAMGISIHPPREGWDQMRGGKMGTMEDFNPPTP